MRLLFLAAILVSLLGSILAVTETPTSAIHKWPGKIISFRLAVDFTQNERRIILSALNTISNASGCIDWIPQTNEKDFLDITTGGNGCFSSLGFSKGPQELHIQQTDLRSSCMRKGIILSLLMRTLGFGAENNRPDRESYIKVNWDNIRQEEHHRFYRFRGIEESLHIADICPLNGEDRGSSSNKECVRGTQMDTLGLEYDYGSITHFGLAFYSNSRLLTLENKRNVAKSISIGQREALSPIDVQKLKNVYCSPHAPAPECKDTSGFCVVLKLGCYFNYVKRTCPKSCNSCDLVVKSSSKSG